jgi:hypothetical protein
MAPEHPVPKNGHPPIVEGQPRDVGARNARPDSRYTPSSSADDYAGQAPLLQFGEHGELTHKTIEAAGLTGQERKLAQEMLKVQAAYLEIYQALDYPTDPDGHTVDLSGVYMTQPKVAIAWTLALLGFRRSAHVYVKKRPYTAPGCYEGAYTYVDVRAPDDAAGELLPHHRSTEHHLPPDTRRLAAMRDGDRGQQLASPWSVTPTITEEWVCSVCKRELEPGQSCPDCAERKP